MIKNLLIPANVGDYYIFTTTVLSIKISSFNIQALLIRYQGRSIKVINSMELILKDFSSLSIVDAIKKICKTIGSYDEIITTLFNSPIIFKIIELPFIGVEQLKLIIPYEIESELPFSLDEAVINFIVLKEDLKKKTTNLLVAAAKKVDINYCLKFFQDAEVKLNSILVEFFTIYTQYKNYNLIDKNSELVFIDFDFETIKILYIEDKILSDFRVIPKGVSNLVQKISKNMNISYYDFIVDIISGKIKSNCIEAFKEELKKVINKIKLSLNILNKQLNEEKAKKFVIIGVLNKFDFLLEIFQAELQTKSVEFLNEAEFLKLSNIELQNKAKINSDNMFCFLNTVFYFKNKNENLLIENLNKINKFFIFQSCFLAALTFFTLFSIYYAGKIELDRWRNIYEKSRINIVKSIETEIDKKLKNTKIINSVVKEVEVFFDKEKKLFNSFSKNNKTSFLEYLQELSTVIDKKAIGLTLYEFNMNYDSIVLKGEVKNFESLILLEQELLELKNFKLIEKPKDIKFYVKLELKEI